MWSKSYRSLAVKVRNEGRRIQCTMLKLGIRVDFLKVFTLQRTVVSRRLSLGSASLEDCRVSHRVFLFKLSLLVMLYAFCRENGVQRAIYICREVVFYCVPPFKTLSDPPSR